MNRGLKIAVIFTCLQLAILDASGKSPGEDGSAAGLSLITEIHAGVDDALPDASPIVIRQRIVKVDAAALTGGAVPRFLVMRLFQDIHYTACLLWSESDSRGGLAWIGRLVDEPNSRITLVAAGDRVSATIRVLGQRYDLRPLENGLHIVQQVRSDALPTAMFRNVIKAADSTVVRSELMIDEELQVLALVNEERGKVSGLGPLASDDRLTAAARGHSQAMSDQNYFSHVSLDGRTFADRIEEAGYSQWNSIGENIAAGYSTPEAVMNGWMNSSGHRANILSDSFCDMGVGYAAAGHYWTQDFGRQAGSTSCTAVNGEPIAAFSARPASGPAPLVIDLDGGDSYDPDGDDLSYFWDLGDGRSSTEVRIAHTFTVAGLYTVRLTVNDNHGGSDTFQRQIQVQADGNSAPRARDDIYICDQGVCLAVTAPGVLANDEDDENETALAAVLATAPSHGTLLLNADGAFEYQPPPDFTGDAQFTYQATDGQFQSETATVTITVMGTNPPVGSGDTGSVDSGSGDSGGCFITSLPARRSTTSSSN